MEACASLEVVDTRFDTANRSIPQILRNRRIEAYCDHIANGAFVVGEAQKHWRDLEFATMPVRVSTDANILVETIGGHPFLDPFPAAVVLVNELRRGSGLQTGQVMATGAFSGFFPVQANQPIVAEFEGVGRATAMFVS